MNQICQCFMTEMWHLTEMHPFTSGCLRHFHTLTIVNNVTLNNQVHISFQISIFISFSLEKYPKVVFLDLIVFLVLAFLKNLHDIFYTSCTNIYHYQERTRVLLSPHPCQSLLCIIFVIITTVTNVRPYLVVLICISLMINDAEHLFMCLLAIVWYSLEKKNVIQVLCPFFKQIESVILYELIVYIYVCVCVCYFSFN